MNIQTSTIDNDYKLTTYSNGAQYIVYSSASWLVGCESDKTGSALKAKYFTETTQEAISLEATLQELRDENERLRKEVADLRNDNADLDQNQF
jgi:demethoxyubiquinone hydroxylase (CLK1/Coq7/Cat5 family)